MMVFLWGLLLAAVFSLLHAAEPSGREFDLETARELQLAVEEAVRTMELPGAVIAIRLPGGEEWTGVAGISRADSAAGGHPSQWRGLLMRSELKFRIGSITKTFTAHLIHRLAAEGRLGRDDFVDKWLPGLLPDGNRIRIQDLLDMKAALPPYASEDFVNEMLERPCVRFSPGELVGLALDSAAKQDRSGLAVQSTYSNTGYILLGMIAEKAGGQPFGELLKSRILEPLGLHDTSLPSNAAGPGGLARGYMDMNAGSGRPPDWEDVTRMDPSWVWAAGGMVSTARDLLSWLAVLKENGAEDLLPRQMGCGYKDGLMFMNGVTGHSGNMPGYSAGIYIHRGVLAVILANGNGLFRPPSEAVMEDIIRVIFRTGWTPCDFGG